MIKQLAAALRDAGVDIDWRELADALWLAHLLPGGLAERSPSDDETAPDSRVDEASRDGIPAAPQNLSPSPGQPEVQAARATTQIGSDERTVGLEPAVSGPDELPGRHGIERALRPFKKATRHSRVGLLNVSATVEHFCETGLLIPLMSPALEPRFDVALIVDGTPSMVVWRDALAVLADTLERHGAFRRISRWTLIANDERLSAIAPSGQRYTPRDIVDPAGQTLVFVVTDCVDEKWRSDIAWPLVRAWGRFTPVSLVQMLPKEMWHVTAHGDADIALASHRPGQPTAKLSRRMPWWWETSEEAPAIPVITLDEDAITSWVQVVMGVGGAEVAGVLAQPPPVQVSTDGDRELNGEETVHAFAATVAPETFKLATWLSAVEVSLPIARVLLKSLLPGEPPTHIAALFASGLLQEVSGQSEASTYDFVPGAREALQEHLTATGTIDVWRAVSPYLERTTGQVPRFSLLLDADSDLHTGGPTTEVTELSRIVAGVVNRLGLRTSLSPPERTLPDAPDAPDSPGAAETPSPYYNEPLEASAGAMFAGALVIDVGTDEGTSKQVDDIVEWLVQPAGAAMDSRDVRLVRGRLDNDVITIALDELTRGHARPRRPLFLLVNGSVGDPRTKASLLDVGQESDGPIRHLQATVASLAGLHPGGALAVAQERSRGAREPRSFPRASSLVTDNPAPWMFVRWPASHPRLSTLTWALDDLRGDKVVTGEALRFALETRPEHRGRLQAMEELKARVEAAQSENEEQPSIADLEARLRALETEITQTREQEGAWGGVTIEGTDLARLVVIPGNSPLVDRRDPEDSSMKTALPATSEDEDDGSAQRGLVDAVMAKSGDRAVTKVEVLPTLVRASDLPAVQQGDEGLLVGISEINFGPAEINMFGADPHLQVYGDGETGKSNLLKLLIRNLVASRTPDEIGIVVVDYRRSLFDVVPDEYLLTYVTGQDQAAQMAAEISQAIAQRVPGPDVTSEQLRNRSWWSGLEVFVIIDDYDLVSTSQGNPLMPLVDLLPQGRDLGFHLVLSRRTGGMSRAVFEPMIQRLIDLSAPGFMFSGDRLEGRLIGGHPSQRLPRGRAMFVTRDGSTSLVQTALVDEEEPLPAPSA